MPADSQATAPSTASPPPPGLELTGSAQENLEVMADIYERDDARVTPLRGAIERVSDFFGSPGYFVFAVAFVFAWIAVNIWGRAHGWAHVDVPPFFWL